jgi:hypothetical protein
VTETRDDLVAKADATEDRVPVAVRVAVRDEVAVNVGKIILSRRSLG